MVKVINKKSKVKSSSRNKEKEKTKNIIITRDNPKRDSRRLKRGVVKRSTKKPKKDIAKITMDEDYKKNVISVINKIVSNQESLDYLIKNIGKYAIDIVKLLKIPKSDDEIAVILDLKINAVRRILNMMQGSGITDYNISKNTDGWLSFTWYIDIRRISEFFDGLTKTKNPTDILTDECNDYFICNKCYKENKLILTFDAAYELGFKCVCNNKLIRISKDKANKLILDVKMKNNK